MRQIFRVWRDVFGRWQYLLLAVVIALVFYSLNVLISSWRSLLGFYATAGFLKTIKLFFTFFLGFKELIITSSFVSLVIISILLGVLFTLLVYKANFNLSFQNKKTNFIGSIGVFLAAFVPGCAACGVGLASLLGISAGALSFLPYKGIELSIIAIIILGITIFKISKNIYICKLPVSLNKEMKGGKKK